MTRDTYILHSLCFEILQKNLDAVFSKDPLFILFTDYIFYRIAVWQRYNVSASFDLAVTLYLPLKVWDLQCSALVPGLGDVMDVASPI